MYEVIILKYLKQQQILSLSGYFGPVYAITMQTEISVRKLVATVSQEQALAP